MLERKINLEEILIQENRKAFNEEGYSNYFTAIQHSIIQKAMKEACKQVLEEAANNAEAWCYAEGNEPEYGVDKQSILNTINQVE